MIKIVGGGIVGLALGYLLLLVFFPSAIGGGPRPVPLKTAAAKSHSPATESNIVPLEASNAESTPPASMPLATVRAVPSTATPVVAVEPGPQNQSEKSTARADDPVGSNKAGGSDESGGSDRLVGSGAASPSATRSLAELARPSAPPPVASIDQFPASVALPPLEATTWQTLVPLPAAPDRVELVPAFDSAAAKVVLSLGTAEACDPGQHWLIKFEASSASNSAAGNLAELQIDPSSGDLQFRWESLHPEAAAALSNSWLRFDFESQLRYLALRQPQKVAPLKLDFEKDRFIVPLLIESLPATDQLFVDFSPSTNVASTAAFRHGAAHAQLDREVVIEFSDLPGAQVGIKLAKVPQAPLGLIVEPRFKDGPAREYDLTFPQLEKSQRGIADALHEAKAKIPILSKNLTNAQSALRTAQGRTVRNGFEARQRGIDVNRLEGVVRDANRRLIAAREQEAEAQTRLNNVPKILAFMKSLNGREFPFRVAVKSTAAELTLVEGVDL
jgi:hypothetical protein